MKKRKITDLKSLLKVLGIERLEDLQDSQEAQQHFIKIATGLTPELLAAVIQTVPDISQAFSATIASMEGVGKALEETKRIRWEVLRDIAKTGAMTGDQVLEAMRIIEKIEESERIDWDSIFRQAMKIVSGALVVALGIVAAVLGVRRL